MNCWQRHWVFSLDDIDDIIVAVVILPWPLSSMLTEYTDGDCQQCAWYLPSVMILIYTHRRIQISPGSFQPASTLLHLHPVTVWVSLCSRLGARRSSLCQHQVSTTQAGTLGMASHTPGHIGPNWRWCLKACPTQIEVNFVIDKLLSAILKRLVLLTINGSLFFSPLECFHFWGQVLIVGCLTYRWQTGSHQRISLDLSVSMLLR